MSARQSLAGKVRSLIDMSFLYVEETEIDHAAERYLMTGFERETCGPGVIIYL